ncbi:DUF2933 domain-containing protein [Sporolactobacillus vineae]|uniref:DUF2933 domain-containing protein n=1 Tax=Sporolactobacillus vineae TaxID=444463 RepID=UPI00028966F1|nr:DUF2933 domain-containing protein [Sporolactobacillus vineae]
MNCCGNSGDNPDNEDHNGHGTHKHSHLLMMAVCFIIPIAVIIGLLFTGGFTGSNSLLILAAVLICPLMHLFMMPSIMKKGNEHHH